MTSGCRGCERCRRTLPGRGSTSARMAVRPGRSMAASRPPLRNELWTGDGLHGPKLPGSAVRAVLLAFIDDHSRLLVGWRWGTGEDVFRLEAALRAGLMARGSPGGDPGRPRVCVRVLTATAGVRGARRQAESTRARGRPRRRARSRDSSGRFAISSWSRSMTGWSSPSSTACSPPGLRSSTTGACTPRPSRRRWSGSTPPARRRCRPRPCCAKRSCGRRSGR